MRAGLILILAMATAGVGPTLAVAQTTRSVEPTTALADGVASNAAQAQTVLPLLVSSAKLRRWSNDAGETVLLSDDTLDITFGDASATARRGVIWLGPDIKGVRSVTAVLLGGATIRRGDVLREGPRQVLIGYAIADQIDLEAETFDATPDRGSTLLETATALRPPEQLDAPPPEPRRTARPAPPVRIRTAHSSTMPVDDKTNAWVVDQKIYLQQRQEDGTLVELSADRAVLYVPRNDDGLASFAERSDVDRDVPADSVYLEGDVRVRVLQGGQGADQEQRLFADKVFFSFADNQALLTEAVLYAREPSLGVPLTLRAQSMRRLANGDFEATGAQLSTSKLANPIYSINARRAYLRERETRGGEAQTNIVARDVTLQSFGAPIFYLPGVAGNVAQGGFPLRQISFGNSSSFGTEVAAEFGLFESFGREPPTGLDATYKLQYLSDRGPALGFASNWNGSIENEQGMPPQSFRGNLDAYVIFDNGDDRLGGRRSRPEHDDDVRGRVLFQQQHFNLPTRDWYLQYRLGYASDPTFLEQYLPREFDNGLPHEASLYLARYRGDELFYLRANSSFDDFVTSSQDIAENFAVEYLPEVGYDLYGRPLADSNATLISQNRVGGVRFHVSDATAADYGFRNVGSTPEDDRFRGIPSTGYTRPLNSDGSPAVPGRLIARGDSRQQIDVPLKMGAVNVVPFVVGRLTAYNNTVDDSAALRAFAGTGVRVGTQMARTFDHLASDVLDIHRVRHVIEPSVEAFTSVSTIDRNDLDIYDENVDGISDLSLVSLNLRNRFQTKRGGPGRWRSVDALVVNTQMNLFANQPDEPVGIYNGVPIDAGSFRGIYFATAPEASYARNGVNASALWRVSDTTALLADTAYNLDDNQLATVAAGVTAQRGDRLNYYIGGRYVGELNDTTLTAALDYKLTTRYSVLLQQSYRFDEDDPLSTNLLVTRRFDRLLASVEVYFDQLEDEGGVRIGIIPIDLGGRLDPFSFLQ